MRRFLAFGPALVVLLTCVVLIATVPALARAITSANAHARVHAAREHLAQDDILRRISLAKRQVAAAVEPSVVHIEARARTERGFRRESSGSGWIFDNQGHVVTNAHVVRAARNLRLQLHDGRIMGAELVGMDPPTDIAVLRLESPAGIVPARRATDARPQQGDAVFAFGSPFGFKFSMSEGIVSGLGRAPSETLEFGGFTNFIQTDAAVNPGNSGGPLADASGDVIGMNVAIATARGSIFGDNEESDSAGISFAIPLDTINAVVPQLIDTGRVRRGFLGISWNPVQRPIEVGDQQIVHGVRITSVVPAGPADRGGLRTNDIIVRVAGQDVTNSEVLRAVVSTTLPGDPLDMTVVRNGEPIGYTVTLDEMATSVLVQSQVPSLSYQVGFGLRDSPFGPVILGTLENSPADRVGIQQNDVVVRVGDTPVRGGIEVFSQLYDQGFFTGDEVDITLQRPAGDTVETITATLKFAD